VVEAARAPTGITALATGWGMSEAELEEAAAAARWRPTTCERTTEGLVSLKSRQSKKAKAALPASCVESHQTDT
jgi:hypothetical protein